MGAKFKFLLVYYFSWFVFFDLMRVLFLLYHADKTAGLTGGEIARTFLYGARMDLSVAAYILLPVVLFVLLSLFIHFFRRLLIYKIYTFTILLLVSVICLADLELYNAWGFRIDATPLNFLTTPTEAMASVSHLPVWWILFFFIASYALFYFCFSVIMKWIFFQQQNKQRALTAALLLVFMAALLIPIRGGLQQSPLNQSSVYFSTTAYANHAAINASWNFIHSVFGKDRVKTNPYVYMDPLKAAQVVQDLYAFDDTGLTDQSPYRDAAQQQELEHYQWINRQGTKPVNVIVVIWESFTEKALHLQKSGVAITPRFLEYKNQGIFFENCYASGDRTNKGIPAVLSGYPAMPNTTIIHSPGKSAKLKSLPAFFRQSGYATPFFYGGETEFANIKSYLVQSGFDPIIGKSDFAAADMNSKWGAHDGVVMKKVLAALDTTKGPFFAGWLTLSSHEPFEVPVKTVISGKDVPSMFLNSLHYTDQVLGDFIDSCKTRPWWDNTVIIIVGDHGHPLPETGRRSDDFRTPMLWTGGAIVQKGMVVRKTVSQIDIAATLLRQFNFGSIPPADFGKLPAQRVKELRQADEFEKRAFATRNFPFSKDMADPRYKAWAFFDFNDGFGFVDSSGVLVFDNVGRQPIMKLGSPGDAQVQSGQALMYWYFNDFMSPPGRKPSTGEMDTKNP
ncbi:MAG: alkaline phosphatase family protein [Chitinophagaceae bacterium]|nr:MAG: alkaline phosphatase family protein [Chitinophagaceae bacterium]